MGKPSSAHFMEVRDIHRKSEYFCSQQQKKLNSSVYRMK